MTYDEACQAWATARSPHFADGHRPVGAVEFDVGVDGYDTSGYYAVLDVVARCSCGQKVSIDVSAHDFNDILKAIVALALGGPEEGDAS